MNTLFARRISSCGLVAALFCVSLGAFAQQQVIPVWPNGAPGSEEWTQKETVSLFTPGNNVVRNVTQPTLTAYFPSPSVATGTGIIVCPGGGFRFLSWEIEGTQVAQWLSDHGVAAFVLKYRLVDTGATEEEFREKLSEFFATLEKALSEVGDGSIRNALSRDAEAPKIIPLAVADGRQAIRLVRQHASEWGIAPDRIGIMGFSAGGAVTMGVVMEHDAESRPNFAAPIYGGYMPGAPVPGDAPPLFICVANDDPLAAESVKLYSDWKAAGHPVELHIYSKGGHGFGMIKRGIPADGWIERLGDWLGVQGLLTPPPASTSASSGEKIDVSGTWVFEVETDMGSGSPTLTFKQEGEKLTGQYQGIFGQAPLTGTLKGNEIEFSFNVDAAGQEATIVYSGTVEQNSMKGELDLGDYGPGTFVGKRE
jgi:acetyl esterase/lipase